MLEGKFANDKLHVLPIFSDSHCMMLMKMWFLHLFSIRHVLVSYIYSGCFLECFTGIYLGMYICESRVQLLATSRAVAQQAPPSMGFSRQEYWSGLLFPSPGDLPCPGIEPRSPALQAHSLLSEPPGEL